MKKTLVFYRGKPPHGSRTDWIMHEYRLVIANTKACNNPQEKNSNQRPAMPVPKNWVLCRIFFKKRGTNRKPRISRPMLYNFMTKGRTNLNIVPCSPSSGSSGITEVSCNESDDDEENSSCNGFPYFRRKQNSS